MSGVEQLAAAIKSWCEETGFRAGGGGAGGGGGGRMRLRLSDPVVAARRWAGAVENRRSKKEPTWKLSHRLFQGDKKHVQSVACNREGARPVQANTIVVHLLKALTFAMPVDLCRLATQANVAAILTREVWEALEGAAAATGIELGPDSTEAPNMSTFLSETGLCDGIATTPFLQKSDEQKANEREIRICANWFVALSQVGLAQSVVFSDPEAEAAKAASAKRGREGSGGGAVNEAAKRQKSYDDDDDMIIKRQKSSGSAAAGTSEKKAMVDELLDGIDFDAWDDDF